VSVCSSFGGFGGGGWWRRTRGQRYATIIGHTRRIDIVSGLMLPLFCLLLCIDAIASSASSRGGGGRRPSIGGRLVHLVLWHKMCRFLLVRKFCLLS